MESISRRETLKLAAAVRGGALLTGSKAAAEDAKSNDPHDRKAGTLGPANQPLDKENVDSALAPVTDYGNIDTFKYPFGFAHKKTFAAGWARQVTIKDLEIFKILAGVNMRLLPNGCQELHWHESAEWAFMLAGNRARTMDFQLGDVGYILNNQPHYIENTGDSDLVFLEIFKSDRYQDLSLNEWITHTPAALVMSHLKIDRPTYDAIPREKLVILPG